MLPSGPALLFEAATYREYLVQRFGALSARTGQKKRAAEALGVHTSLVSLILGGKAELSPEHAEKLNGFLEHGEAEAEYFLHLVLRDRAGTPALRQRLERRLAAMRAERLKIRERVGRDAEISEEDQDRFYSSYIHSAIHVLVTLPNLHTREALARALGLPRRRVAEAVEFLIGIGVLRERDSRLEPGSLHIHLGAESRQIHRHHLNWRLRTLERLHDAPREDLHYSAVVSLSEADVARIKDSLLRNLAENAQTITASPPETAFVYCFDFFRLPLDSGG